MDIRKLSAFLSLALILSFTIFCVFKASQIKQGWVLEGGLPKYMEPQREFDWVLEKTDWAYDTTVIGIHNPHNDGIFNADFLRAVSNITKDAKKLRGFGKARSLANYQKIKNIYLDGYLQITTYKLLEKIPENSKQMDIFRQDVLNEPKLVGFGHLVSQNKKSTVIILEFFTNMGVKQNYDQKEIAKWLDNIRKKYEKQGFKVHFYGGPSLRAHIDEELTKFIKISVLAAIAIIAFVGSLFFGFSARLAVLLCGGLMAAIVVALGLTASAGAKINVISAVGLVIAPAAFGSYAIQFLARYFETKNSIGQTIRDTRFALLLSAFTSLCGFAPLVVIPLVAVKDYSIFSSFAILAGLGLSLGLIPVFLFLFPLSAQKIKKETIISKKLERALISILDINPKKIIVAAGLLSLFAINILRLEIRSNPSEFFPKKDRIQKDLSFFRKEFGATGKISFIIDTGDKSPINAPLLAKIELIQEKMERSGKVASAVSINEIIKIVNREVDGEGKKEFYFIPEKGGAIKQLLTIFNSKDMTDDYLAPFANRLKVDFWTEVADSKEIRNLYYVIKKETKELKEYGRIFVYGDWVLWSFEDVVAVYWKLVCVFFTSLLLLISWFRFKDYKITLFCLIPPLLTNLIVFGVMGMLGIHLEIASATLATIVFGMGADSPIHYFERYLILKNVRKTHLSISKPLVIYTVVMVSGFLTLVFSHLKPLQNLGLLIAAALILNVGFTIFLAPHFLLWKEKKQKEKEIKNESGKRQEDKEKIFSKVAGFIYLFVSCFPNILCERERN